MAAPEPDAHHTVAPMPRTITQSGPGTYTTRRDVTFGLVPPGCPGRFRSSEVVHPCGARHGSQADRDPDWPLRPELAAPLGVWPSSQLAECVAGRRCWPLCGDVAVLPCCTVYRITSVFPCVAECSAVCQPKLRLCAGWRWGGAARVHCGQEILSCCAHPSDRGHDAGYGAGTGLGGKVADRRPEGGQC